MVCEPNGSLIQFPLIGTISGAIWALIFGVIFTTIGFLDTNLLNRANSFQITMFALMMYVFDGLKDCTPEMLKQIIGPMIILIIIGVAGMALVLVHHREDIEDVLPAGVCERSDRFIRLPM